MSYEPTPFGRPQWRQPRKRIALRPAAAPRHPLRWLPLWCALAAFLFFCLLVAGGRP